MTRLALTLLVIALTGCEVCEKHATACAIAAGVAGTCVALSLDGHRSSSPTHDVTTQPVSCANPEACR